MEEFEKNGSIENINSETHKNQQGFTLDTGKILPSQINDSTFRKSDAVFSESNQDSSDDGVVFQRYSESPKRRRGAPKISPTTLLLAVLFIALIIAIILVAKNYFSQNNGTKKSSFSQTTVSEIQTTAIPNGYEMLTLTKDDIKKGNLVLINSSNKYDNTAEGELVRLYNLYSNKELYPSASSFTLSTIEHYLKKDAAIALKNWLEDFNKETGTSGINIITTYRSFDTQKEIFDYYAEQYGSDEEAKKHSAFPGYSEHHSGLCFDLGLYNTVTGVSDTFTGDGDYSWLNENAYKYGLILRYPEDKSAVTGMGYEPWHFRYIGIEHASAMKKLNSSCFEIYINFLSEYSFNREHLVVDTPDGSTYEIYYVKCDTANDTFEIPVPTDKAYSYSGNNVDGIIVSVKIK